MAIAAGLVVACGGDSESPDEASAAAKTTTADTTPTTPSDTEQVRAAFEAYNAMLDRLRENPNPEDPEIPQRASGEALAGIIDNQTTIHTRGLSARFGERNSLHILDVTLTDPTTAVLRDCQVEDRMEILPSGETLGPFIETFWTAWTLRKADGAWRVDSSVAVDRKDGEHPCV